MVLRSDQSFFFWFFFFSQRTAHARQGNGKGRAFTHLSCNQNSPAHAVYKLLCDRQSKTRPLFLTRVAAINLPEHLEDIVDSFLGHPAPGIAHLNTPVLVIFS